MQNTHELLVGTLSIGIPSILINFLDSPKKNRFKLLIKLFNSSKEIGLAKTEKIAIKPFTIKLI